MGEEGVDILCWCGKKGGLFKREREKRKEERRKNLQLFAINYWKNIIDRDSRIACYLHWLVPFWTW